MPEAVILSAVRTPIGRYEGALTEYSASELGAVAIRAAIARAGIDPATIDEVLFGNVIQAGNGQNVARQAARQAGVSDCVPGMTINQVCASGLRAVALAAQAIRAGEGELFIAGGTESMTNTPTLALTELWGHDEPIDAMLHDGLQDADDDRHMGKIAEHWAAQYGLSRAEQDAFALASQQKCAAAIAAGAFADELIPVDDCRADEHPRPNLTAEELASLLPAFATEGTITAGNAAGLNDGAAALVIASAARAAALGVAPLGRIVSYAWSAREPQEFGIAPAQAVSLALQRAGLTLSELDLIECNEAFAVQVLALTREVGWDLERVNVNGGAIALGHPIGASGARLLVTLLHALHRRSLRYGLATLCAGGGMGIAMIVERR